MSNLTESKSFHLQKQSPSPTLWLVIVFAVAFLVRLLEIFFYQPVTYSDTPSYRRLAETVLHGFANYDGTRTPGYPAFLALAGNDQQVWLIQLLLGFITTFLLFYIGWKLTDKPWFGGLIALAHTLNLGQLFFESNLLTETLTTFLLVLTMVGALAWLLNPKVRSLWLAFLLGLISSVTLLVRPLFIYLPFLILIFVWLEPKIFKNPPKLVGEGGATPEKESALNHPLPGRFTIAFLIPVVFLLGGWITFIHNQFGDWSLTTMTGYHLVQHTGNFFEYVPNEYAALRDTYIKYRDAHIAQYGTQTNAIWDAIPEMSQVSGYSFYELSRVLTRISIQLILKHPFLFLKSAISGWWMFWRTSVYWSADALRIPWLTNGITFAVKFQRVLLFMLNLVFIFSSIYFALIELLAAIRHRSSKQPIRFTSPALHAFAWMVLANIWIASILQTLLDHGDNPRFLVPLQSLVVLWVGIFILQLVIHRQSISTSSSR
jgi:hypothetical protein